MIHSLTLIVVILCVLWVIGVIIVSFPLYALYSIAKREHDIQESILRMLESISHSTLNLHKLTEGYELVFDMNLKSIENTLKSQRDEIYRFHKSLNRIITAYNIPNIPDKGLSENKVDIKKEKNDNRKLVRRHLV